MIMAAVVSYTHESGSVGGEGSKHGGSCTLEHGARPLSSKGVTEALDEARVGALRGTLVA